MIGQMNVSSGKESQFKNLTWSLKKRLLITKCGTSVWIYNDLQNMGILTFAQKLLFISLYKYNGRMTSCPTQMPLAPLHLTFWFLQSLYLLRRMRASRIQLYYSIVLYCTDS